MAMLQFAVAFPKVATAEMLMINVRPDNGLELMKDVPPGQYAFCEFYCDNPSCDCREVLIVVAGMPVAKDVATFYHAIAAPAPGMVAKETALSPEHPQSPYAATLLKIFLIKLRDEQYLEQLRRHYQMVKDRAFNRTAKISPPPPRRGKKWKRKR